jgi:large subunit ribosomal protein L13
MIAPIQSMKYTVDASNKILGRLATEIAAILNGKKKAGYLPFVENDDSVEVIHAGALRVTGKKASQKVYARYTGYPGGIRKRTYEEMYERNPGEILRKAVYGMLAKNKLRARYMKKLVIMP